MNAITQIIAPGVYDMAADRYHSDPCPVPSLSSSIAKKLVRQSPMHAHYAHPRLGGNGGGTPTQAMDDGTILHAIILGKGGDIEVIEADDFRTNAAKAARDAARAAGKTPILAHKLTALRATAHAIRKNIEAHPAARRLLGPGKAEQAMIWEEDGVWFRSLVDWMPEGGRGLMDLKTTGLSAAPGEFERKLIHDYAFQDAFYARGYKALMGVYPDPMLFVAAETEEPCGVSVMAAALTLRAVAEAEVERAVRTWRHCMTTNEWPGYPPFVASVEAPNWLITKMGEQENQAAYLENAA
jgi:hypothetical protein